MVTWGGVLLFIRILVFLIYDDQPQITKRQKNRGTDSENHVIALLSQLFLPYLHPLSVRKLGMINPQARTEYPLQALCDLSGQCNLRQEIQYLFPLTNRFFSAKDRKRTNLDLVVGSDGVVLEEIDNLFARGQVKVGGQVWSARSQSGELIPADTVVTVLRIEGVKVFVQPKESADKP